MDKNRLQIGKSYIHKRTTVIDGVKRTAERWLKCKEITDTGAVFYRDFEPDILLTDKEIQDELHEGLDK